MVDLGEDLLERQLDVGGLQSAGLNEGQALPLTERLNHHAAE